MKPDLDSGMRDETLSQGHDSHVQLVLSHSLSHNQATTDTKAKNDTITTV